MQSQIVYEVKLDDQKGKIISIQQIEGIHNLETEAYLSAIQFEKDSNGFITSGIIEILAGGDQ